MGSDFGALKTKQLGHHYEWHSGFFFVEVAWFWCGCVYAYVIMEYGSFALEVKWF